MERRDEGHSFDSSDIFSFSAPMEQSARKFHIKQYVKYFIKINPGQDRILQSLNPYCLKKICIMPRLDQTQLVIWPRSILLLQREEIEAATRTQYTPALIYEGHFQLSKSCAVYGLQSGLCLEY